MATVAVNIAHYAPPLDPSTPPSAWADASALPLRWDVIERRDASEATSVHVATDGTYIFVRFDATQSEPIAATQHNDDVGKGSDDAVWVDFWPNGSTGFTYQFQATPNGTHYESSSENATYAPRWESHGALHPAGYTVTMKIPFNVMHAAHGGAWLAQFVRYIHATGEEQVWSFDMAQILPDDVARAGTLTLPQTTISAARPQPRAAVYGLAEAASHAGGG